MPERAMRWVGGWCETRFVEIGTACDCDKCENSSESVMLRHGEYDTYPRLTGTRCASGYCDITVQHCTRGIEFSFADVHGSARARRKLMRCRLTSCTLVREVNQCSASAIPAPSAAQRRSPLSFGCVPAWPWPPCPSSST